MSATTADHVTAASVTERWSWLRERGMGATVLVSAISAGFGVLLITATGYIGAMLQADPYIGDSETLAVIVAILSVLLLSVAIYVGAIVTANTFATIVAGRTRRIALMRLIGATARSQRYELARQGLIVGMLGAVVGLVIATALAAIAVPLLDNLTGAAIEYQVLQVTLLLPAMTVAATTWVAAWVGSRRVISVTPLEALAGSVPQTGAELGKRSGRKVVTMVLGAIGALLLIGGILLGLISPLGVVVAFFGGLFSFTALTLSASHVIPPLLRLSSRAFGSSAPAKLAAENAFRYPERSARMAIGVVMGVALVTMFAVAAESVKALAAASAGGEVDPVFSQLLDSFAAIMMVLVGVSAVIAAVGLVNLLAIGIVQRRRELGLLRALGLSGSQIRQMVLIEAAHITITSLVAGLALGTLYGWIAAQSLLGSVQMPPAWLSPTFVWPAVPWVTVAIIVALTAVLTLVAAVVPTRLATRVAPVAALADAEG